MKNEKNLIKELNKIGIMLAAERDISKLLKIILEESIKITNCDGGSIYVKEFDSEKNIPIIRFKEAVNLSRKIEFKEFTLELNKNSIAGYSAMTGEVLILNDVNNISQNLELHYNNSFDNMINYKTINMLVVPMVNYNNEVVGVMQLINKKKSNIDKLSEVERISEMVEDYEQDEIDVIKSLTAQAGILLERTKLYEEIQELLSSFIQAMVTTIDSRDITTSGHSRRLAGYALGFAEAINRVDYGEYKNVFFTKEEIKELYYAALLHDIGKVGVKEDVLQKRTKISEETLELLEFKFLYFKDKIVNKDNKTDNEKLFLDKFDIYLQMVKTVNQKPFLTKEEEDLLRELNNFRFSVDGKEYNLFKDYEFENLKIKKGNLTENEREEINSHVVYSFNILNDIRWIKDLKKVPIIAGSHHERIDGTGYPRGLKGEEISVQARILGILDIFEALTARDRPYKPAMSVEKAITILEKEVEDNHLDKNLFDIFMKEKIYELYKEELNKIFNL